MFPGTWSQRRCVGQAPREVPRPWGREVARCWQHPWDREMSAAASLPLSFLTPIPHSPLLARPNLEPFGKAIHEGPRRSQEVSHGAGWRRMGSGSGGKLNMSIVLHKCYFLSPFLLSCSAHKRVSFPWRNKTVPYV